MERRLGPTHLDALDTLSRAPSWLHASEVAADVGRGTRSVRETLLKLERKGAARVERIGRAFRYEITGHGLEVLASRTIPGDYPPRGR